MNIFTPSQIQTNITTVRARIKAAAVTANRDPRDIKLVAVSKFHPASAVQAALQTGQVIFGENRIQEAKEKFSDLFPLNPAIQLHIIGPIQKNKIVDAVKIATIIETIDREALFIPLVKAMEKTGKSPKLFIQINTGEEPQKAGVLPKDADAFIVKCCQKFGDLIQGVMGIPPINKDPIAHFQQLAYFAKKYDLPEISMGMSSDFETAIACGSTIVRVGSAIFGDRPIKA